MEDKKTYTNPVVCSYCKKHMYDKPGFKTKAVSHGICDECLTKLMADFEKRPKTESLISFEQFLAEKISIKINKKKRA